MKKPCNLNPWKEGPGENSSEVELEVLLKTNYILKGEHALGPNFNPQSLKGRGDF